MTNMIARELAKELQNEFVIAGAIELYNIELIGVWEVYNAPKGRTLAAEFKSNYVD